VRSRCFPLLISVAVIASLNGCGGGSDSPSTTATPTPTPTVTPTPTPTPSGIPPIIARAFAEPSVPGANDASAARVEVRWSAPSDVPVNNILEYHVYRDNQIIGVTTRNQTNFTDGPLPDGGFNTVTFQRLTPGGSLEQIITSLTALAVGVSHTYSVEVLYQVPGSGFRLTTLRTASGLVTPVARPGVTGPTTTQDLSRVRVAFQTVQGADQYVFEFADNPDFTGKVTEGPLNFAPVVENQETPTVDLSPVFASLPNDRRIYFRVGARNSTDAFAPLSPGIVNGGNFVYSTPLSFPKSAAPPPPPAPQSGMD
jgi:hypothetical protein